MASSIHSYAYYNDDPNTNSSGNTRYITRKKPVEGDNAELFRNFYYTSEKLKPMSSSRMRQAMNPIDFKKTEVTTESSLKKLTPKTAVKIFSSNVNR